MSAHRFFLQAAYAADEPLPLSADDVVHAMSVLRVHAGEEVVLVEPGKDGRILRATVDSVDRRTIRATVIGPEPRVSLPRITLIQGLVKGEKMDQIVRQAVELGVEEVVPVVCERSIARVDAKRRAAKRTRWERIARSAAVQSRRDTIPEIADVVDGVSSLTDSRIGDFDGVLVAWEEEREVSAQRAVQLTAGSPARDLATHALRVAIVVGPEGGLAPAEVETLVAAGAITFSLGPTVLRAETAAVAALVATSSAMRALG